MARRLLPLLAAAALVIAGGCGSSSKKAAAPPGPPPDVIHAPVQVAHTADGTVSYRSVGSGPTLLLLMGFGGSIDAWAPPFVNALAQDHRVVMMDNAGVGQTAAVGPSLTAKAMAGQVAAFIHTLGLGSPTVLGWSMGTFIAQSLAVDDPTLVSHLILCAGLPGDGHATHPTTAVTHELEQSITDPTVLLSLLYPADQRAAGIAYGAQIQTYPGFYLASEAAATAQLPALASWTSGAEVAGHEIGSLKVPTLVLGGSEDVLSAPANATYLADHIPGAQETLYPDAGHAFLFQDEPQVVGRIDTFLR